MKIIKLTLAIMPFFFSDSWATEIVAFHGLNQSIRADAEYKNNDCTAGLVNFETHHFIENTIPSVDAAFKMGATIGHINLRKTADNQLAVFHDDDLSCRTNGTGLVSQSTMSVLKKLDVGYNYTPDKKTFPTRGFGVGLMPTFEEVLQAFPNRPLAINVKSTDETTAKLIEQTLSKFPSLPRKNIIYIGHANDTIRKYVPGIQMVATEPQHLQCLNAITSKSGIKEICEGLLLALPFKNVKPLSKDLPHIITSLHAVNAKIWVWNVNSPEDAKLLKGLGLDAIGTYRIDKTISELK